MNYFIFQVINGVAGHWDWIDDIMEFLAQDIVWIMIAMLAIFWFTRKEQYQRSVFYACLTAALALVLASMVISPGVNHPRPFITHIVNQLIPHSADASFPSDHSTIAFSFGFCVQFYHRKWGIVAISMAVLTGIARVYVGVHYPFDIAGAAALAFVMSYSLFKMRSYLDPIPDYFIRLYNKLVS